MLIVSYFTLMKLFGGSALQVDSSSGDKATVISLVQWIGNKYLVAHKQVIINDDDVQKGIELFGQMPNSILHAFQLDLFPK